ncbi:MAG: flagellar hook capping FlgD N-terminal domain-containing protein [Acidobacteriota bacterium]
MAISPTTATDPISAALNSSNTTGPKSATLGKDVFMQLLITKMQNQDPTQPQDDSALLAQLAQFSTLEQMQQMNTTLTNISDFFSQAKAATELAASSAATTKS